MTTEVQTILMDGYESEAMAEGRCEAQRMIGTPLIELVSVKLADDEGAKLLITRWRKQ